MACTPKSARLEAAHSTVIFSFLVRVDSVVPSSARSLRKTGVSSGTGIVPTLSNRSSRAGEAGALAISRASCSVISAGTLFGARAPSQASRLGEFDDADLLEAQPGLGQHLARRRLGAYAHDAR